MKKLLGTLLGLALLVYIAGIGIFSIYTYPTTTIDGSNVGFMKQEDLYGENQIDEIFTIKTVDEDLTQYVTTKRYIDPNTEFTNPVLWFTEILNENNIVSNVDYSFENLGPVIENLNNKEVKSSELIIEDGQANITESSIGYAIPTEDFEFDLENKTIDFTKYAVYPEVQEADLEARQEEIQSILNGSLTLLGHTLEGEEYFDLFNGDLTIDKEKAMAFVTKVAEDTDTINKNRTYTNHKGQEITLEPGVYGWLMDKEATTNNLIETKSGEIQPSYVSYAKQRDFNDDIGSTYVEVSIQDQKMYAVKDGKVVIESDVVTGHAGIADTPKGVFVIWHKELDAKLKGINRVRKEAYVTPVKYWMPIDWTGVGFHDAEWNPTFGGERYKTAGSNGCINLPEEVAKELFETFDVGTPTVIY